ncbi:AAA family ATPase [Foetidibacter luteolus]|uniref:AAA family ATPase n=1 Tax=Foetidibacter luteolus TaxID=2608880 RepID=UPI00129B653D|nr:AAA family ATPase [Foetidibacter luteolus]
MNTQNNQKTTNNINVFDNRFLNSKSLYMHYFGKLPNVNYISSVDGERAFNAFTKTYHAYIKDIHEYSWFEYKKKKYVFDMAMVVLNCNFLIEFDEEYCYLLHDGTQNEMLGIVTTLAMQFKERQRRQPLEINLICREGNGMTLRGMEIKRARLDIDLFYEDEFKPVNDTIIKRLNQKKDKGIVLLHGLPGTGKTTYLRYLIGKIKKRVLFLSPNIAGNLMSPDFIDLLIDNPDTVLIIEDAENIILDRRMSNDSSVSNLLNISDGLLADFLNVQLICTFNSSLTLVDSALMRKGRLIAKYEFGKLSIEKAQRLSTHFGFDTVITQPMTVAEISNQHEKTFEPSQRIEVLGFRRDAVLEN